MALTPVSGFRALTHPMNPLSCFGLSSAVMEVIKYGQKMHDKIAPQLDPNAEPHHVVAKILFNVPIKETLSKIRDIPRLGLVTILVMSILVQASRMTAGSLNNSAFFYNIELLGLSSVVTYYVFRDSYRRVKFFYKAKHDFLHNTTTANQGKNISTRKKLLEKSLAIEVVMLIFKKILYLGLLSLPCLGIAQIISLPTVGKITLGIGFGYFIGSYFIRAAAIYHNENIECQIEDNRVWSISHDIYTALRAKIFKPTKP